MLEQGTVGRKNGEAEDREKEKEEKDIGGNWQAVMAAVATVTKVANSGYSATRQQR